jgi:hypothetical protein
MSARGDEEKYQGGGGKKILSQEQTEKKNTRITEAIHQEEDVRWQFAEEEQRPEVGFQRLSRLRDTIDIVSDTTHIESTREGERDGVCVCVCV